MTPEEKAEETKCMDWQALFKNPQSWLFILVLMLLGVEVFPALPGTVTKKEVAAQQKAALDQLHSVSGALEKATGELDEYRQKERDDGLRKEVKSEVMVSVEQVVRQSIEPLAKQLSAIEREIHKGARWTLDDEVALWRAGGEAGPDPRKIQAARLAEEVRESFRKDG